MADKMVAVDGRDALAYVIVRPVDDDEDRVAVEAAANGISKIAGANVLRQVADLWTAEAEAEDAGEEAAG